MDETVRILIIEDLEADADLAQREIRKSLDYCEFQRVETSDDYLKALDIFKPDLILSDYNLPRFDGMKALELVLERSPLTPLIIWTGSMSEDVAVDCMKAGANNYIIKENIQRLGPAVIHALEERRLRVEQKQAEEKYQAIFEGSPVGIFQSTPDGRFLNVNPAMARIYGYDSPWEMVDSITGIARQIYHEPDQHEEFKRLFETQDIVENYERKNIRKDGSIFWTSTSARAIRDANGKIHYYEGFLQDITEQKHITEKVREQEERFRALIEHSFDNISLLSANGTLLWENPAVKRTLGFEQDEHVGRNIFELMHPDDMEWTTSKFTALLKRPGEYETGIFRLKHQNGSWRWIEVVATNLLNESSVKAVVINYRDITERKQAEIELKQRNDDLALVSAINAAVLRGEDLDFVVKLLGQEMRQSFSSIGSTVYMLDRDGQFITMQQYFMSSDLTSRIENLIGRTIPLVRLPVREGSNFHQALHSNSTMVISGQEEIQKWIGEFVETTFLPPPAQKVVRKLIPQIYKLLNIKSVVTVPLVSDGKAIGLLDISRSDVFSSEDVQRIENIAGHLTTAIQRQQADSKIKRSEKFLQSIHNALSANIAILDGTGTIVQVNSAWRKFGELNELDRPDACIGMNYLEVCDSATGNDSEEAALVAALIREVIAGQRKDAQIEYPCHSPDEKRWFDLQITRFDDGNRVWIVLVHENVTEKKVAENTIRELARIPEENPNPIIRTTHEGKIIYSNDGGYDWLDEWEITTGSLLPDKWKRIIIDVYRRNEKQTVEIEAHGRIFSTLIVPIKEAGYVNLYGRDITKGKQAEEILQESENRFRNLFENSPVSLWEEDFSSLKNKFDMLKEEGVEDIGAHLKSNPELVAECASLIKIRDVNNATLKLFEAESKDDLTVPLGKILKPASLEFFTDELVQLAKGEMDFYWEGANHTLKGRQIYVNLKLLVLPGYEDTLSKVIVSIFDITERRQAEIEQEAILKIMQGLTKTNELQEFFKLIHNAIAQVIYAENFFIVQYRKKAGLFEEIYSVDQNYPPAPSFELEKSITAYVFRTGEPIIMTQPLFDELSAQGEIELIGTNPASWLGVPLKSSNGVIGVIAVQDYENPNRYSEHDKDFLASIGSQVAVAIERMLAEQALLQSEKRYRTVVENQKEFIVRWKSNGIRTFVNDAYCQYFGVTQEEALSNSFMPLVHEDDRHAVEAKISRLLSEESSSETDVHRVIKSDGSIGWQEWTDQAIYDEHGAVIEYQSVGHDITEQKQAENALRESQSRYRSLFENSPISLWEEDFSQVKAYFDDLRDAGVIDFRTYFEDHPEAVIECTKLVKILDVNRATLDLLEIDNKSEMGGTLDAALSEEALATTREEFISLAEGNPTYEGEEVFHTMKGKTREIIFSLTVAPGYEESLAKVLVSIIDITERKATENAERDQRAMAEALRDTAEVLNSTLEYEDILDHILTMAGRVVPYDTVTIMLIEDGNAYVARSHGFEERGFDAEIMELQLSLTETTNLRQMLETKQPVVISDTQTYPGWKKLPNTDWLRSNIGAPISISGDVIGFILLDSEKPGFFNFDHADRLISFANQAALAIHNSLLLQQAQAEIAERKGAEDKLKHSHSLLNAALEASKDGILVVGINRIVSSFNRKFLELWKIPYNLAKKRDEKLLLDFVRDQLKDPDAFVSYVEKLYQTPETESSYEVEFKDGRIFEQHSHPQRLREEIVGRVWSFRDITKRKRAEESLRAFEERFRQLADNIQEVFWMTDAVTDEEIYLSPASEKIWGQSVEAMLRDKNLFIETILPEDRQEVLETLNKQRDGQNTEMEYRIALPDGTVRWIWDRAFPIFDDAGKVVRLAGIAADVTDRKQAEERTERHLSELEALYENGLAVSRLLEPREIGERVIQTFKSYLSWHHVTIRLLKNGTDQMELVAYSLPHMEDTKKDAAVKNFDNHVSRVGQGLSGWVVQTGRSIRTGSVYKHPQYVDVYEGMQSGLYMPLMIGKKTIGVISVESEEPDAFNPQDERLLATLANQAAIAFENARLYQSIQQELTERKRVESALRVSETHYRELADSITDIFFELDQNMRYTHWNKASEMLTGIPEEKAIGMKMTDVFGESDEQKRIEGIYENVLKTHQSRSFDTVFKLNNEKHSFEINAYPSNRGVAVVAKDVTESKQTEILLQKRFELMEFSAHNTLDELMQKIVDEVCELTGSLIGFFHFLEEDQNALGTQTWSTNTLKLFNVPLSEGEHRPLDQAGAWAEAARQRKSLIHNDFKSNPQKKGTPKGHLQIVRNMVIPIIRNEKIVAVMGVANKRQDYSRKDLEIAERLIDYAWDVTERKQMQTALADERNQLAERIEERTVELIKANSNLARALRVKDEFLANMSHELRTPLNAILGLSESLTEQITGPLNEKQLKYMTTIGESGHHLLSLINDILDLAKIEAGQITLDINKVDIHSVCQASLRMVKQLAQKKNQKVTIEVDKNLSLMWADERRLKQMIVNLLSNAVKFTPENGALGLEVHVYEDENRVEISVWDKGMGISKDDLARIFTPFVQLDSGLARESTGTGLGLALVSQMARLHGGSVTATSQLGKGSRFTIKLPWEPALARDPVERLKNTGRLGWLKSDQRGKTNILLIEDTSEVVMMIQDYLETIGYVVTTAQDGIEGINQASLTHPDLIIMDIQMPRLDGIEATKRLRADPEFSTVPIIALTALAMQNDRERCLEAGMNDYISKPVNLKALVKTIQKHLSFGEEKTQPL